MLWSAHLSTGPVSHEQKLSQSLEIALTSTLGSMPSFTARLTKGQLQHLGTRCSSTSGRPSACLGNLGPPSARTLKWVIFLSVQDAGPGPLGSVGLHSQLHLHCNLCSHPGQVKAVWKVNLHSWPSHSMDSGLATLCYIFHEI